MRCKILVGLLTALSCMTVSGVFAVYPANADTLTVVDLTKEQTLALYGTSVQGSYYTGSEWRNCTFEYYGSSIDLLRASDISSGYSNDVQSTQNFNYTTQQVDSLLRNNEYLLYRCSAPSPSPTDSTDIQFTLDFSTSVQGIAYYRQLIGFCRANTGLESVTTMPLWSNWGSTAIVSYSPTPITTYGRNNYNGLDNGYVSMAMQSASGYSNDGTGTGNVYKYRYGNFACTDVYLQDIDSQTGTENTFSVSGQTVYINRAAPVPMWTVPVFDALESPPASNASWGYYYVIALSTPRVTDGYILPTPETTTPDYTQQLDDIIAGQSANTTLLQAILAKLDLIYQQMQNSGIPSPTLTPAHTIPPTLQQYYSGIASGVPSASGISAGASGASLIPFSGILSASGLSPTFGLLVALACAGWVLTKGRN